jgi:hypothetical protein
MLVTNVLTCDPRRAPATEGAGAYRLERDVTLIQQDGEARLLDMRRGRFYALDELGTRLLALTLEAGPEEAARRVAEDYDVPAEQVRADLDALLGKLQRRRLLGRRAARRRGPARFRCLLLLTAAWLSLRVLGWAGSVRLWRRWHRPQGVARRPGHAPAVLQAVDRAVRDAASWHPLNPQCKERALVGWHLLRGTFGLPAEMVVGAQLYPFLLHVWVECGASVVTDDRTSCEAYVPVARYA